MSPKGCVAAIALLLSPMMVGSARASCVAPSITLDPQRAHARANVTISGSSILRTCNDHGCIGSRTATFDEVELILLRGREIFEISKVDTDGKPFRVDYTLPRLAVGHAQIAVLAGGKVQVTAPFEIVRR